MSKLLNSRKVERKFLGTLLLCSLSLFYIGCGKSSTPATSAAPLPAPINTSTPSAPGSTTDTFTWADGAGAPFQMVSSSVFNRFVTTQPVDPTNLSVNVKLTKASGKGTYYGQVRLRYLDGTKEHMVTLDSGSSSYKGKDYYMYNYWFHSGGQSVFSGFFSDERGSVVLVIDQANDLGDGGGSSVMGGSLWFKNFTTSYAPYDGGAYWSVVLPCWFRTIGPYDCRSPSVMNKTSVKPDGYIKLGTFSNMDRAKAFEQ